MLACSAIVRHTSLLAIVSSLAFGAWGCKRSGKESKPVVLGDPVAKCDALAPARRMRMVKSADAKTLLFHELNDGKFNLHMFDVDGRVTRSLVEDIKDIHAYQALADGNVVCTSNKGVLFLLEKDKVRKLTMDKYVVESFAVEETSSTIVYARRNLLIPLDRDEIDKIPLEIMKLDIQTNKVEKLTEGKQVIGAIPGEKAVLLSRREGKVARVPLDGGKEKVIDIGQDRFVVGQTKGHVITWKFLDPDAKFMAVPLNGGAPIELDFGGRAMEDLRFTPDGDTFFVYEKGPNGVVFKVDGATVTQVLKTKGPRIKNIVALDGDVFAALAEHDTNGDGESDKEDEIELCFIERHGSDKPVDIPTRTVPLAKVPLAQKLAPLFTEADLTGATLTFRMGLDKHETVWFESPKDGPGDLAALRKRARDIRARIVELTGADAQFDVRVQYADARFAESRWIEATNRHLSYAGVGAAATAEPSEYDIELFPQISFMQPGAMNYGPVLCTGKVKNIGQTKLEKVNVACSYESGVSVIALQKAPLTPATLAPGATGSYRMIVTLEGGATGDFRFAVTSGGSKLSQFNRYASEHSAKVVDVAVKVFAKTGLQYMYDTIRDEPPGERRKVVFVEASESFAKSSDEEQKARAQEALKELYAAVRREKDDFFPLEMDIFGGRGTSMPTKVFSNGVLRKRGAL